MTAHTPAPQAGSVSALLASFSSEPSQPQAQQTPGENFSDVISQAVTSQSGSTDDATSGQPAKDPKKPGSTVANGFDSTAASLLLALLAPPLPHLTQVLAKKAASRTSPDVTLAPEGQASGPISNSQTKAAKGSDAPKTSPEADQIEQQKEADAKEASALGTLLAREKSPLLATASGHAKEGQIKAMESVGTPAANTSQRMSLNAERNEIAGRTEQKLPPDAVSAVASVDTGGPSSDGGAKSTLSFAWHDTPPEPLMITDLSAKVGEATSPLLTTTADAPASSSSATSLQRLESMIAHESLIIRQTGAQTLGVSLKLDSNTQLYLQLTNHNGSVQASVRCERGSFAPEDAQWAQLQQALAKQNVTLQPMSAGANLNFKQPSDERSRQQPPGREELALPGTAVPPAQPRKQKEQKRPSRNWESWA